MRRFLPNLQDALGRLYGVETVEIDPMFGDLAFRVFKPDDSEHYDIHRSTYGTIECDCADYTMRKKGTGKTCKHGTALIKAGFFPERRG